MTDTSKLHTIRRLIPEGEGNKIGMDTKNQREGLHLWIIAPLPKEEAKARPSMSVHLSRQDAKRLIEEIQYRLF